METMNFDRFRDVDVVIDKANDSFIQKQWASTGDKNGRTLTVMITDAGIVGEVPNVTLSLLWRNLSNGITDEHAFTVKDKATSKFIIAFPNNMLTPGKVIAQIRIWLDEKVIATKPFEIEVGGIAGAMSGVLKQQEFGLLTTVLADAINLKSFVINELEKVSAGAYDTVSSVTELNQKYPNGAPGNANVVVLEPDGVTGFQYSFTNGSWKKGSRVQNQGVAANSIDFEKINFQTTTPYISSPEMKIVFESNRIKITGHSQTKQFYIVDNFGVYRTIEVGDELTFGAIYGNVSMLAIDLINNTFVYGIRDGIINKKRYCPLIEVWWTASDLFDAVELLNHRGNVKYETPAFASNTVSRLYGNQIIDKTIPIAKMQNPPAGNVFISGSGKITFGNEIISITGSLQIMDSRGVLLNVSSSDSVLDLDYKYGNVFILGYDYGKKEWVYIIREELANKTVIPVVETWLVNKDNAANFIKELVTHQNSFVYNDPQLRLGKGANIQGFNIIDNSIPLSKLEGGVLPMGSNLTKTTKIFNDWKSGIATKIAIVGDSTTNGVGTNGAIVNDNPGTVSTAPLAYPQLLNNFIKSKHNLSQDVVLNGGYSGKDTRWIYTNRQSFVEKDFKDVKMFILRIGINDRFQYPTSALMYAGVKKDMEATVLHWLNAGYAVALASVQAIIAPSPEVNQSQNYNSRSLTSINKQIAMEIADKYGLEFIDLLESTESFMLNSNLPKNTIIQDNLHFNEAGHKFTTYSLYSYLNKDTVYLKNYNLLTYLTQCCNGGIVTRGDLTVSNDKFKMTANYTKANNDGALIYNVFANSEDSQRTLKFYRNTTTSSTYIKVNDQRYDFDGLTKSITLDVGSYDIEVWSGASNVVDFKGIEVTN